jgi:polysaccharide pyruvyl transferase WcaK-like protein
MKKIGILTYFWSENPGTFLQAYSMLQALRKRFPNDRVELVNYRHRWVYFKPNRTYMSLPQWFKDFERYRIYKKTQKEYLLTSEDALISRESQKAWDFIEKQCYDLIVVGSDTVLELHQRHKQNGSVPVYWLPPQIGCKKVMCAASARALTCEELNKYQQTVLSESVNNFDLLGVRDDATFDLIIKAGLKDESKLRIVPDPTFSYEIDYNFINKGRFNFPEQTIALHFPRVLNTTGEKIAAYYREKGFQILSIGPAKYADLCLVDISPFEWAGLFRKCRLVITHRFHDTIFSLKNLTPVITVEWDKDHVTNRGQSKYHSLLRQFGLHRSNLIRYEEKEFADRIIRVGDDALEGFDEHSVREKLTQLKDGFNRFVDKIASLAY